jgi:hypothetical protein
MKSKQPAPSHRGISVRHKEYSDLTAVFDTFRGMQVSLMSGLDADISSLQRDIALRQELKNQVLRVNKES